jgi:magnesium chelatase family protein
MFARAKSGTVIGVKAHSVVVEAHRGKGLPGMTLIGLARGAVRESAVRVRSAIMASEITLGTQRTVVNLLPAELPKEASALDLPLAVALLAASGIIPESSLVNRRFFGELSLGGALEPVRGGVLLADLTREHEEEELILPLACASEAAVIPGVRVLGASSLKEVVDHLLGLVPLSKALAPAPVQSRSSNCLSQVCGQPKARRALEIAAAGGHNLLMVGPPGSGKTMLARSISGILPPLDPTERIEVTRIHSAAGRSGENFLVGERPMRSPHHTASEVALCGGGSMPRPGEVTLAHRGILFLDEIPEFSRRALEALREPLEDGVIHIARAALSLEFPANVLLVAAMNPCPCGYHRGLANSSEVRPTKTCMCSFEQIQRYRAKISGPLLDRIDMHVLVDAVPYRAFVEKKSAESSGEVRKRVVAARDLQRARGGEGCLNANLSQPLLDEVSPVDNEMLAVIERAMEKHGLSTRAVNRLRKVARTITDLEGDSRVSATHLEEALSFRVLS